MKYQKGSKVYNKKVGTIHTVKDYPIHEAWHGYFTTEEDGKNKVFHDSEFCLVNSFEHWIEKNRGNFIIIIAIVLFIYFTIKLMQLFYV